MSYKLDSRFRFRPNLKELGETCFNEKNISQDNTMRYLRAKSCENARINKFVHKKCCMIFTIIHSYVCYGEE